MSKNELIWGKITSLNDYQAAAMALRLDTADDVYCRENLVGEVGEYFSLRAKARRDGRKPDHPILVKKELGDILWQFAMVCADEGYTLEDIANSNIIKLTSRKENNTLQGSGDYR
jgi:NTP pyrophosphatase (non-canonical NTP hydrolase)